MRSLLLYRAGRVVLLRGRRPARQRRAPRAPDAAPRGRGRAARRRAAEVPEGAGERARRARGGAGAPRRASRGASARCSTPLRCEPRFGPLCERLGVEPEAAARSIQLLRLMGAVKLVRAQAPPAFVGEGDLEAEAAERRARERGAPRQAARRAGGADRGGRGRGRAARAPRADARGGRRALPGAALRGRASAPRATLDPEPLIERALRLSGRPRGAGGGRRSASSSPTSSSSSRTTRGSRIRTAARDLASLRAGRCRAGRPGATARARPCDTRGRGLGARRRLPPGARGAPGAAPHACVRLLRPRGPAAARARRAPRAGPRCGRPRRRGLRGGPEPPGARGADPGPGARGRAASRGRASTSSSPPGPRGGAGSSSSTGSRIPRTSGALLRAAEGAGATGAILTERHAPPLGERRVAGQRRGARAPARSRGS